MTTGNIDKKIAIYTQPKSREPQDVCCKLFIIIGNVFFLSSDNNRDGIYRLFHEATNEKMNCTAKAGFIIGKTILLNVPNSLEPSILDASIKSFGKEDLRY